MTIDGAMKVAVEHHREGRLSEAEGVYRQILERAPNHAAVLHLLGVLLSQRGDFAKAIELITRAVGVDPKIAEYQNSLGICLLNVGHVNEAIAAFKKVIEIDPNRADTHLHLGRAQRAGGQLDEATDEIRSAVRLDPRMFEAQLILGELLTHRGLLDEAAGAFGKAIELRPDSAEGLCNLGVVHRRLGKNDLALEFCNRAIQLKPDYAQAFLNSGVALNAMARVDEAIAAHQKAVELSPDHAEAYHNMGGLLANVGRIREAIVMHRRAVDLDPESAAFHSSLVFALQYHPDFDSKGILEEAQAWSRRHESPLAGLRFPARNNRETGRRLRIGYVSPDFRDHALGRNLLPLFENRDRSQFEIFYYSDVIHPDGFTARIQAKADHWRRIVGRSDEQVARIVREDEIDILVDISMHMPGNRLRLFARKPAPIQAAFGAYPGTTGLGAMDYRLTDPVLDPPGQNDRLYSERTIHLPHSFWCFDPAAMDAPNDPVNPLPALANGHVTLGSLNNPCKINDVTLDLWARVLSEMDRSRLLLLAPQGSARRAIVERMEAAGIDPRRIEFSDWLPRQDYLKVYQRIDLGLDAIPCSGHTTSMDSFWMGVAVVTFSGGTIAGRAGASMLTNLGLTDLIARTPDEYVATIKRIAGDLSALARLRAGMRERMKSSPLTDGRGFAAGIENAYREMWKRWMGSV